MLAIMLPTLFGIVGLVIDSGLMMNEHRNLQHAADAASTAAAMNLRLGKSTSTATATANEVIHSGNQLPDATVTVNIPPQSGAYAGKTGYVEVIAEQEYQSYFMRILDGILDHSLRARSVAGAANAPAGAAIVVLDPDPADLSASGISDDISAISANNVAAASVPQTGASDYLASTPVVGPTAATLMNTSLGSLIPTVITNCSTMSSVMCSCHLPLR